MGRGALRAARPVDTGCRPIYAGFRQQGANACRVRLWTGDDGESALHYAVDVANRARDAGLKPYLVLFFSENWADMVKPPAPAIWKTRDEATKLAAIEAYAERVTRHLIRNAHDIRTVPRRPGELDAIAFFDEQGATRSAFGGRDNRNVR